MDLQESKCLKLRRSKARFPSFSDLGSLVKVFEFGSLVDLEL